jgi:hypothetical protein
MDSLRKVVVSLIENAWRLLEQSKVITKPKRANPVPDSENLTDNSP